MGGEGGIRGKLQRYSSTNTLSYCSRKASALALSEEHTRLSVTKAGIPRDSVLSNFRYDQARLIPLEPAPGGALRYFLGGYVPSGNPNWHPVLKKISPKIDTPF